MTSAEFKKISDELSSYSKLKNNWDGEDGITPLQSDIYNAEQFLELIKNYRPPISMISGSGEVGYFWPAKLIGIYIDLGFLNGGFSYYAIDKENKEYFRDEDKFNKDTFSELLNLIE